MTKKEAIELLRKKQKGVSKNISAWVKTRRGRKGYLIVDNEKREIYFIYQDTGTIYKAY